jgi:hypothetical protein
VQSKEQQAESQNCERQDDGRHDHEDVGLTRRRNERRQMMGSSRMELSHDALPAEDPICRPL